MINYQVSGKEGIWSRQSFLEEIRLENRRAQRSEEEREDFLGKNSSSSKGTEVGMGKTRETSA